MDEASAAQQLFAAATMARQAALAGDIPLSAHYGELIASVYRDCSFPCAVSKQRVATLSELAGATVSRHCLGLPPCPSAASPDSVHRAVVVLDSLPEPVQHLVVGPLSSSLVASLPSRSSAAHAAACCPYAAVENRSPTPATDGCSRQRCGFKRKLGCRNHACAVCCATSMRFCAAHGRTVESTAMIVQARSRAMQRCVGNAASQGCQRLSANSNMGPIVAGESGTHKKSDEKVDLPQGWAQVLSRSRPGQTSFVNLYTQERQSDLPTRNARKLPSGWTLRPSSNRPGYWVYINKKLKCKQAKPPRNHPK